MPRLGFTLFQRLMGCAANQITKRPAYGLSLSRSYGFRFNLAVRKNQLTVALCNDHARRRFRRVHEKLSKHKSNRASLAIASQGLKRYNELYAIERKVKELEPEERLRVRQEEALPLWESFIDWATQTYNEGVRHAGTHDALQYLLKHAKNLQTYCHDPRVPISNIKSEHVAKTIAVARNYAKFLIMLSDVLRHTNLRLHTHLYFT